MKTKIITILFEDEGVSSPVVLEIPQGWSPKKLSAKLNKIVKKAKEEEGDIADLDKVLNLLLKEKKIKPLSVDYLRINL